ncbi:MAG: acyl carrier protein [Lachnospiraceae bacterium]|nr:acyl carrier protein [Lachnospiraceae bacterium]
MERDQVLEQVIEVVEKTLKVKDIDEDTYMQDDLHIESLDFYSLLANLEKQFRIRIPERVLAEVETVGDIVDEVMNIQSKKG